VRAIPAILKVFTTVDDYQDRGNIPSAPSLRSTGECYVGLATAIFALFLLVHRCDVQTRRGSKQYLGSKVTVRGNDKHRTTMALALNGIIGHSPVMQELTTLVLKVAPHNCTVLIRGESGTGKELIARSLQENSKRAKGPFVPLNCGAMPDALTESILFGHEKGSFTGASSDKRGLFETANGGTIFLDEIGEMPCRRKSNSSEPYRKKRLCAWARRGT